MPSQMPLSFIGVCVGNRENQGQGAHRQVSDLLASLSHHVKRLSQTIQQVSVGQEHTSIHSSWGGKERYR